MNLAFRDSPVTTLCPYDGFRAAVGPGRRGLDASGRHQGPPGDSRAPVTWAGAPPPRCTRALSPPPAQAEALNYRDDLYPVRSFVTSQAEHAGLTELRITDLVLATSSWRGTPSSHRRWRDVAHLANQRQDHLPGI